MNLPDITPQGTYTAREARFILTIYEDDLKFQQAMLKIMRSPTQKKRYQHNIDFCRAWIEYLQEQING